VKWLGFIFLKQKIESKKNEPNGGPLLRKKKKRFVVFAAVSNKKWRASVSYAWNQTRSRWR
jgi:hypothetical protein